MVYNSIENLKVIIVGGGCRGRLLCRSPAFIGRSQRFFGQILTATHQQLSQHRKRPGWSQGFLQPKAIDEFSWASLKATTSWAAGTNVCGSAPTGMGEINSMALPPNRATTSATTFLEATMRKRSPGLSVAGLTFGNVLDSWSPADSELETTELATCLPSMMVVRAVIASGGSSVAKKRFLY